MSLRRSKLLQRLIGLFAVERQDVTLTDVDPKLQSLSLADRKPVWEALSTLFLDTDVSLLLEYRAGRLASSPYNLEELEAILANEVYPVCKRNLTSIAGEWAGFDEEWLASEITARIKRQSWFRWRLGQRMLR